MEKKLPSEERKWLHYYSKTEIEMSFSKLSLFEAIHHVDDENRIALKYFGISVTYSTLYKQIDLAAKAFIQNGINKGDVVMLMLPTLPESVYCFYALNKIGAIANMIDVRSTPSQLVEIAKKTRPKMLVVMSFYLKQLETVRKQLGLDKIILLRGCDSMPASVTFWYKLGEHFNRRRKIVNNNQIYTFWQEFLESGISCNECLDNIMNSNDTAVIFQTSGTTGFPKSVIHVNETLDFSAKSILEFLNNPHPGDTLLSILPIFTLYGFVSSIHMPLRFGLTVLIVPLFKPCQIKKFIIRDKPNFIFSVPSQWEHAADKPDKMGDLSFIKNIVVAGEILDRNVRIKVNKMLQINNSNAEIRSDYGMTETGGSISTMIGKATVDDPCDIGYSGIPLPFVRVCIYDNEKEQELGYNCRGEICVQSPYALKEYLLDKTETDKLRRKHPDGSKWIHTGDIGYLTEKGHLYIVGRSKRMIVQFDGTKIFPIEIESVIRRIDGVGECSVVPARDPNHSQGCLPFVFVVSKNDENPVRLKQEIFKQCAKQLPFHLRPYKIRIIDQMPHNSMGKVDYRKLIEMI